MKTETSDYAIETDHVARKFGDAEALRDFTLRVRRGSVYGFLGRNGAGKTTAIKILAGLIRPTSGTAQVMGRAPFDFTPEDRQRIGYVSEKQILPDDYRVGKIITFCASLYPRWDGALVKSLVSRFRIDTGKKVSALSLGGQRSLAIILALAQKPDLLILDEPAANLDVVARRELLDEILALARQDGPTVFFSSHVLSDIERVADDVGIIADGTLRVSEALDDLKDAVKQVRFHSFPSGTDGFSFPGALRMTRTGDEVLATVRVADEDEVQRCAERHGAQCEIRGLSLEDIFVEISRSPGT